MAMCAAAVWTIYCHQNYGHTLPLLHVQYFHVTSSCARSSSCLVFLLSASSSSPHAASDLEQARPQTSGEEELQLQLALAMSREESQKVEVNTQTHDMFLAVLAMAKKKEKKTNTHPPSCSERIFFPLP